MISTSYDLEDSSQRNNSSTSNNDEESIFLSSSSDDDAALSAVASIGKPARYRPANNALKKQSQYIETMINDDQEAEEDDEELEEEDEENDEASSDDDEPLAKKLARNALAQQQAAVYEVDDDDEDDSKCKYIPTPVYSDDDHLEAVSDDDEHLNGKPTFDEYDPENIDKFDEKPLAKTCEYEPTVVSNKPGLRSRQDELQESSDSSEDSKKSTGVKTRLAKLRQKQQLPKEPEVRSKRKYNRRQVVTELASNDAKRKTKEVHEKLPPALVASIAAAAVAKKQLVKKPMLNSNSSSSSSSDNSAPGSPVHSPTLKSARIPRTKKPKLEGDSQPSQPPRVEVAKKAKSLMEHASGSTPTSKAISVGATAANASANIISGRIINLSSGFKIPKRPSYETTSPNNPPEKKPKTSNDEEVSYKPTKSLPNLVKSDEANAKPTTALKSKPVTNSTIISKPTSAGSTSNSAGNSTTTNIKSINTNKSDKSTNGSSVATTESKTPKAHVKNHVKPAKNELQDSDLFMEALGNISVSSRSSKQSSSTASKASKASAALILKPKPYVHQQTPVDTNQEHSTHDTHELTTAKTTGTAITSSQLFLTETQTNTANNYVVNIINTTSLSVESSSKTADESSSTANLFGKSNLSEPGLKKAAKKKVVWADSCLKQLEQVSYFYLDEIERDIKKSAFKGGDMAKIEKLNEKELKFKHPVSPISPFEYNAEGGAAEGAESSWPSALIPIELPEGINVPEIRSIEHDVQVRREQNTLAVLMFKQFLPDSPSEPDDIVEPNQTPVVKIIPLDDATLNSSLSENEVTHQDIGNNNVDMIDQTAVNQNLNDLNDPVGPFNNHQSFNKNKFYNPNNKKNSYESNELHANNNKSNNHGYYNQQHHQHQKRQQQQQQQQQLKNNKPTSSNVPALVNVTTNINATVISPSSPPPIVSLTSSLKTDVAIPINKSNGDVKDPTSLISISNSLLSSDEMTEKIKQILNQINRTSASSTDTPAPSKPVEVAPIVPEPVPEQAEEDMTKASTQVFNGEYKKNSKWHNNNNNSNNWNPKFNQNQNNFQNSNNRKPGFYRNNNSNNNNSTANNTNGNTGQTNGTSSSNMNNNNNNNRNTFQNNFRRGIGNRGGATSNHSNFRANTNISNFNNNNNNQYEATNPKGFGHGGAGANPNSNGTGFRMNYNNNNNNNNNSNNNRGRYNQAKSYHNTDADANYENSMPKSKEITVNSPTVATTAAATTAGNSSNRGGWI